MIRPEFFLLFHLTFGFNTEFRTLTTVLYDGSSSPPSNQSVFFGINFGMEMIETAIDVDIKLPVSVPYERGFSYYTSKDVTPGNDGSVVTRRKIGVSGKLYLCDLTRDDVIMNATVLCSEMSRVDIDRKITDENLPQNEALTLSMTSQSNKVSSENFWKRTTTTVCAPLRQRKCGDRQSQTIGGCLVSDFTQTGERSKVSWQLKSPCKEVCSGKPIDMIFLVDGSQSVNKKNFQLIKEWIIGMTEYFNIANDTQVGVVQYSHWSLNDNRFLKTEIKMGFYTKEDFDKKVEKIEYHGYKTYTAHAINKTIEEDFKNENSRYPSSNRILILLTDGNADDSNQLDSAIKFADSEGVIRFAIGVGTVVNPKLLLEIASNKENVIKVSDFDQLYRIIQQLKSSIATIEGKGNSNMTNGLTQCEVGFSSYMENGRLLLGAVGAFDWSGTIAKYDSAADNTAEIPDFSAVQEVLPNRTKESYLGYSVVSGKSSDLSIEWGAAGAPRYYMRGAVVVFSLQGTLFKKAFTIEAPNDYRQFGSYFGGSLLSIDLNNDNNDDLLISAPLYIGQESDEGRVFVYIAKTNNAKFNDWGNSNFAPTVLKGKSESGARFGTSMAAAGDLNGDGFNDVVIGAPMTEGGKGAIYVYHGSSDGIQAEPRQRIAASDVVGTNLQYFGQSIQGGVDLDGNGYPDIAVGAPKSDTIAIFRSRPVVTFSPVAKFSVPQIKILDCLFNPTRQCFNLTVCLTDSGDSVEDTVGIFFKVTLDPVYGRLKFKDSPTSSNSFVVQEVKNATLRINVESCWDYVIYVEGKITNYNAPVTAVFDYGLTAEHKSAPLSSISDPLVAHNATAELIFDKNCGNLSCRYDLNLQTSLQLPQSYLSIVGETDKIDLTDGLTRLVVGEKTTPQTIVVSVNLTNQGSSITFDTFISIKFSSQLSWNELIVKSSSNPNYKTCMQDTTNVNTTSSSLSEKLINYEYDVSRGNIMPQNHWCAFDIKFTWDKLKNYGNKGNISITLEAINLNKASFGKDTDLSNNKWTKDIPVVYRADVDVKRKSIETPAAFNLTESNSTEIKSVEDIGKDLKDTLIQFEITGRGYSNIPNSSFQLTYPSIYKNDLYLLYLYDYQCSSIYSKGSAQRPVCTCDNSTVNPLNLSTPANPNNSSLFITSNTNMFDMPLIDCSNSSVAAQYCQSLKCQISNLGKSQKVNILAKFRIWTPTFSFVKNVSEIAVMRSVFVFDTSASKFLINRLGENVTEYETTTDVSAELYRPPVVVRTTNQIWIYILAAIGGLLLLLLVVFILYKIGFFKSKYAEKKEQLANEGASDDLNEEET